MIYDPLAERHHRNLYQLEMLPAKRDADHRKTKQYAEYDMGHGSPDASAA